jgi:hypothetical protein
MPLENLLGGLLLLHSSGVSNGNFVELTRIFSVSRAMEAWWITVFVGGRAPFSDVFLGLGFFPT